MDTLTDCERAALIATLRELGAQGRLEEIARDFAQRGVHALLELDPTAEELFDGHYWQGEPARLKGQKAN